MSANDSIAAAYDSIASAYDRWPAITAVEDVPFYVELAREADGSVVELGVGTGRVAAAVARETGKRVIGIDSSAAMLEEARATGADLDLRLMDMCDLELEEPAGLVYCPGRSLLHVPTWQEKRRVFERIAASLLPGGRFAWNAFVFHPHVAARLDGERQEGHVAHTIRHAPADNRIDMVLDSGGTISLWWATRSEWEGLIEVAGLEVEALYGDFERTPFDEGSSEFVYVARRPA